MYSNHAARESQRIGKHDKSRVSARVPGFFYIYRLNGPEFFNETMFFDMYALSLIGSAINCPFAG